MTSNIKRSHKEVDKSKSPDGQPENKQGKINILEKPETQDSIKVADITDRVGQAYQDKIESDTNISQGAINQDIIMNEKLDKLFITMTEMNTKLAKLDALNLDIFIKDINSKLDNLQVVQETVKSLESDNTEHKVRLDNVESIVKDLQDKVSVLSSKKESKDTEMEKFKREIKDLKLAKERLIYIEAQSRRDNLIINGLKPTSNEKETNEQCLKLVYDFFVTGLKITDAREKIKIVRAHRLSPLNTSPMIVKFHFFPHRNEVWSKRFSLKGKGLNIWIEEDFPQEIKNDRQILKPYFNKALMLKLKPKMAVNKLLISGKVYTTKNLETLPDQIKMNETFTTSDKVIAFSGTQHPLSNMYPSTLSYQGATYSCVNQFTQFMKADMSNDVSASTNILDSKNPYQMTKIGDKVTKSQIWNTRCDEMMSLALELKFTQNKQLGSYLCSTGDKLLVAADVNDVYWGVGLRSKDERCADPDEWQGNNMLGQFLMALRNKLL